MLKARVYVTLKKSVFDPQGKAIHDALGSLGYRGVADVRQGKFFELAFEGMEGKEARFGVAASALYARREPRRLTRSPWPARPILCARAGSSCSSSTPNARTVSMPPSACRNTIGATRAWSRFPPNSRNSPTGSLRSPS